MSEFHRREGDPVYTPPGGPPQDPPPRDVYASMGEEKINAMIRDLYAELERSSLRPMFPEDMDAAAAKSAAFFVFLLGGPPLYQQRFGPPRMRARHLPFKIDGKARALWLGCFEKALTRSIERGDFPADRRDAFWRFLDSFSAWMVNAP